MATSSVGAAAPMTTPAPADTLQRRPLAGMASAELAELMRDAGMHPPAEAYRCGQAALSIRADLTVADAQNSAEEGLRLAAGVLTLIECDEGTDARITDSASAALHLVRLSLGHLAVIRKGLAAG